MILANRPDAPVKIEASAVEAPGMPNVAAAAVLTALLSVAV